MKSKRRVRKVSRRETNRSRTRKDKAPSKKAPSRSRHRPKRPLRKVPSQADTKKESAGTNNHEGMVLLGFTVKQLETRAVLLEPGVTTYFHAARRLGTTENAVKKRMSASYAQVSRARQVIKEDEEWHRQRKLAKQGKLPLPEILTS